MTAATILQKIYNWIHVPGMEVVSLTLTDGETYQSKHFNTLLGAVVCSNNDNDNHINVEISGAVATVNWNSATDLACTLILFGKK